MKDITELMAQWSKEVLQEERFVRLQSSEWPEFVRTSGGAWRSIHDLFINAIFERHKQFRKRLLKTPGGKEKYIKLRGIKNVKGYSWLKE